MPATVLQWCFAEWTAVHGNTGSIFLEGLEQAMESEEYGGRKSLSGAGRDPGHKDPWQAFCGRA